MTVSSKQRHPAEPQLVRLLAARGSTKRWVARQLGWADTKLAHILAGDRPAPADFEDRLARVLGVPPELLRPAAAAPVEMVA